MYKLLIVDDEPLIRQGLKKLIDWDELGIAIIGEASNGVEALEVVRKERPQILICDIKMPEMDGLELLKRLSMENIDTRVIILSGYDNFTYLKMALNYHIENYLLKPVNTEELRSTIKNIIDTINRNFTTDIRMKESIHVLKNNILNRMVNDQITTSELDEKLQFLNLNLSFGTFRVVVLEFINLDTKLSPNDARLQTLTGLNIVEDSIQSLFEGLCFFDIYGRIVVIVNEALITNDILEAAFNKCIDHIHHAMKVDTLITVGREIHEIELIYLSYNDCIKLMDYKFVMVKNKVLFTEETTNFNNQTVIHFNHEFFENCLLSCKEDEVCAFLDDFYNKQNIHPYLIWDASIELVLCAINVIKILKLNMNDIYSSNKLSGILKAKNLIELNNWLKKLCVTIIQNVKLKKENPKNKIINDVLTFINGNYCMNISLKTLSAEYHLNPAYLGQLFKQEVNEIFTDYLNKVRVNKAKDLLLNTDYNANEISKMVGYNDPNYFYKVFKKYAGVFPTNFRSS